jgi:FKBP-type peptidyl-prolyl cis-trans isomerase
MKRLYCLVLLFLLGCSESVTKTPSGLRYQDLAEGTGEPAKRGDIVEVNYTGSLSDGTVFDSSYKRNEPITFVLGTGKMIQGWDEGLAGMKPGGRRKLIIPPALAYGAQGRPGIPPNSELTFEVEMVRIIRR